MRIVAEVRMPIAQIRDAPRNANRMDPARYAALRAAITAHGFVQPVLVRQLLPEADVEIIDGHHRVAAARELAFGELPCVLVDCTDQEAAQLGIAMNRLRGELNLTEVAGIFTDLIEAGVDPALLVATGFTIEQVDDLINAATEEGGGIPPSADFPAEPEPDGAPKAWVLELPFGDKKQHDRCKRALRRAAGKGEELSVGLLRLIDGAEE